MIFHLFIHQLMNVGLGCFHFVHVISNGALKIHVCPFVQMYFHFFWVAIRIIQRNKTNVYIYIYIQTHMY